MSVLTIRADERDIPQAMLAIGELLRRNPDTHDGTVFTGTTGERSAEWSLTELDSEVARE